MNNFHPNLSNRVIVHIQLEISRLEAEFLEARTAKAPFRELKKLTARIKLYKSLRKSSKV